MHEWLTPHLADECQRYALLATRFVRAVHKIEPLRKLEGAGKAGCPMHPQPCVRNEKHTSVVTTGSPDWSGLPCAMVLTVSFVLSPAIGLFVTVAGAMR
jgi:hypothetical protein